MTIAFHPYVDLFPLIDGHEFYELADDIRINGLKDRITLLCGDDRAQILDGRNRFRALVWIMTTGSALGPGWAQAGWPERGGLTANELFDNRNERLYWLFNPELHGDPLAFVLSKNLSRRHLSESQRAIVAGRLANIRPRGRALGAPCASMQKISTAAAAVALNVSKRSAARGRKVVQFALPAVTEAVEQGRIRVSVAEHIAAQAPERQAEIIASLPRDARGKLTLPVKQALQPVIREIRAHKQAAKADDRMCSAPGRNAGTSPNRLFGVAIDDFEWDHARCPGDGKQRGRLSMPLHGADRACGPDEIMARRAERYSCLADDCVLFTWTAIWCLDLALKLQKLHGFRYVSSLVWTKAQADNLIRPGQWFNPAHEFVLVGVRGRVTPPPARFRSSLVSQPGDHDDRPDDLHRIIEFHWPDVPKVEFHARRPRPGWAVWRPDAHRGDEAGIGVAPRPAADLDQKASLTRDEPAG